MKYLNRYLDRKIKEFYSLMRQYCTENNIKYDMNSFLNHKKESQQYVSSTYKYLWRAPKEFLANSRSFMKYRSTLDSDFKEDLLSDQKLKKINVRLKIDRELRKTVNAYLKDDAIV